MKSRLVVALVAFALGAGCVPHAQVRLQPRPSAPKERSFGNPELFLVVRDQRVKESSGLAASPTRNDWLYTHNDSGDSARVFRIGPDGKVSAEIALPAVSVRDCEDMASATVGGVPYLYLGDIGDNEKRRDSVFVHRFREPGADGRVRRVETFELVYPDGPRDAEALMVWPGSGELFLVEKTHGKPSGVYLLPGTAKPGRHVLQRVGEVRVGGDLAEAQMITGGDVALDGRHVVLRTYLGAYEFSAPDGRPDGWWRSKPTKIRTGLELQGEAIAYSRDGRWLYTSSEGSPCPIQRISIR